MTLPAETPRRRVDVALGMAIFIGSWSMAFLSLFLSFLIIRNRQPAWPPAGVTLPSLPVAGCKDSSGDPTRLLATVDSYPGPVWTGNPALIHMAGALGCAGGILALANVAPELCAAAFAGDADAMRKFTPTHLACERDFPRGVKQLVAERFGTSEVLRMG